MFAYFRQIYTHFWPIFFFSSEANFWAAGLCRPGFQKTGLRYQQTTKNGRPTGLHLRKKLLPTQHHNFGYPNTQSITTCLYLLQDLFEFWARGLKSSYNIEIGAVQTDLNFFSHQNICSIFYSYLFLHICSCRAWSLKKINKWVFNQAFHQKQFVS